MGEHAESSEIESLTRLFRRARLCLFVGLHFVFSDEPGAEHECEKLLTLALSSCPDNPDALYASANLRTIQQRLPEATELIHRCLAVLQACRARSIESMGVLSLGDRDQQAEDSAVPAAINLYDVSYELRVAVAKLALELEAFKEAYKLLEQLLEEDDRVLEVEHLAAVAAHNTGDFRSALAHCDRALELLASEEDAGMAMGAAGGAGAECGEDEDEQLQEDEEGGASQQQQQQQQEEIDASKRALTQLRAQCAERAKTQPPEADEEEEEEGGGAEDEEEAKPEEAKGGDGMED